VNSQSTSGERTLAGAAFALFAMALVLSGEAAAQKLEVGLHVELPSTTSATPMPEADKDDAFIVTVAEDGSTYLGVELISVGGLEEQIHNVIRYTPSKQVYMKGDIHASYGEIAKVLSALHSAGVSNIVLLTAQAHIAQAQTAVLPQGIRIGVDSEHRPSGGAVVVHVLSTGRQSPVFMLNDSNTTLDQLRRALAEQSGGRSDRSVLVKADGQTLFGELVRVIDACHSAGADVTLQTLFL